jgi:hypothetical protein
LYHLEFLKLLVLYSEMKVASRTFLIAYLLQRSYPTSILEPIENGWVKNRLGENPLDDLKRGS